MMLMMLTVIGNILIGGDSDDQVHERDLHALLGAGADVIGHGLVVYVDGDLVGCVVAGGHNIGNKPGKAGQGSDQAPILAVAEAALVVFGHDEKLLLFCLKSY